MASLANAIQFVESNIEDLDKDEVKNKILEELQNKLVEI
jgi:prefoldin subunit 5